MATTRDVPAEATEPLAAPPESPIADPGPLGLAGFAMTTMVLSVFNAGLIAEAASGVVLGLAFFYGGIAQLLAGMWEFRKGNTFGAVAFASYGGFWLSFWFLVAHTDFGKATASDVNHAVGVYLLGWLIFTTYMFIASTRTSGAVMAVFAFLAITYLFLAIGKFGASPTATGVNAATKIGGWLGLITAALAWYASFAAVANSTFKRVVLPTFPR